MIFFFFIRVSDQRGREPRRNRTGHLGRHQLRSQVELVHRRHRNRSERPVAENRQRHNARTCISSTTPAKPRPVSSRFRKRPRRPAVAIVFCNNLSAFSQDNVLDELRTYDSGENSNYMPYLRNSVDRRSMFWWPGSFTAQEAFDVNALFRFTTHFFFLFDLSRLTRSRVFRDSDSSVITVFTPRLMVFFFLSRNPERPYWPTDTCTITRRGVSGFIFTIEIFFFFVIFFSRLFPRTLKTIHDNDVTAHSIVRYRSKRDVRFYSRVRKRKKKHTHILNPIRMESRSKYSHNTILIHTVRW